MSSKPGHHGAFRYTLSTGQWDWSERTFEIFGFAPGDVVPSTELILAHLHPEDRARVERVLDQLLRDGEPVIVSHRLVDAEQSVRHVVTAAAGERSDDGALAAVAGQLLDLTERLRRATSREVADALAQMSQSRPTIEQAKGALMLTYGVDADAAFELLRKSSQLLNVKVRDVALRLVESAARDGGWPAETRLLLDRLAGSRATPAGPVAAEENPGA